MAGLARSRAFAHTVTIAAAFVSAAIGAACSSESGNGAASANGSQNDGGAIGVPTSNDGAGGTSEDAGSASRGDAGAAGVSDGATDDASHGDHVDAGPRDAGTDASSDAAADAAPPPPPPPPPPADGGACNAIANNTAPIPEMRVAADPPAPQGGTLVVGTYVLTRWEIFTGPGGQAGATGNTRQYTMVFGASTYDEAIADNGGTPQHFTRTWSTQGTFFSSRQLCPTVEDLGDDYTATPTTLTLSSYGVVFTLTRQ